MCIVDKGLRQCLSLLLWLYKGIEHYLYIEISGYYLGNILHSPWIREKTVICAVFPFSKL